MTWTTLLIIWIIIAIIYTAVWWNKFSKQFKNAQLVNIITIAIIWLGAPLLLIYDITSFVKYRFYMYLISRRAKSQLKDEAESWEDQRETMYNAWKRKQEQDEK